MEKMVSAFLQPPPQGVYELEARFKGSSGAPLTRGSYNNVVRCLGGLGFKQAASTKMLRIGLQGVRAELVGLFAVQTYCRTDELPASATFQRKKKVMVHDSDYGVRLALSTEQDLAAGEAQQLRNDWSAHLKKFRFLHRISFKHPDYPNVVVDCSVVKSSAAAHETFAQSALSPGNYEVEVEGLATEGATTSGVLAQLKKVVTVIVGGVQGTPYPIPHARMGEVVASYSSLLRIDQHTPVEQRFVGPNCVTLQYHNMTKDALANYVVTDKADGLRKFVFVNAEGECYFLTPRMAVEFTNSACRELRGTVLDGEFVERDKDGKTLHLFAVFDIYAFKGADCRAQPFTARREKMAEAVALLQPVFKYKLACKTFFRGKNVHEACKLCLTTPVPYKTDGLIFTPEDKGVGVTETTTTPPNKQFTWDLNYKWKPPHQNTIDFSVSVKELSADRNLAVLGVMCKGGKNWDKPQEVILLQTDPSPLSPEGVRPFMTEEDSNSHQCYLNVVDGKMLTEEGEAIEAGMVVEFRYDHERPEMWKWSPTRVRWDKTLPNSFLTAHSNWETIQNPITEEMVMGTQSLLDHRYYVGDKSSMKNIRGFHRFVKGELLREVTETLRQEGKPSLNLIDLAVGQAGDIWRWRNLRLAFVFGIDLNKHNIANKQDGACIRYLTSTKRSSPMYAIFVQGDSSMDLLSGEAHEDELDTVITRAVLGKGDVTPAQVQQYPNVASHFGTKFQICSMMFALHYMFKSNEVLDQFVQNVATCTALGGYFVGTVWDGKKVFKRLEGMARGEAAVFDDVAITKDYDEDDFPDDSSCVGRAIQVSQTTFNDAAEYLVNFTYLERALESAGFKQIKVEPFKALYGTYTLRNAEMSAAEQEVSFMNSMFVYKKVSEPDSFESGPSFTRVGFTDIP